MQISNHLQDSLSRFGRPADINEKHHYPKWYDYKTSLALVQTHGRGMKFEEDYCTTYFIDNRLFGYVSHDAFTNVTIIH